MLYGTRLWANVGSGGFNVAKWLPGELFAVVAMWSTIPLPDNWRPRY
jgi:hypothetical protein